jgi:hypothetical protein
MYYGEGRDYSKEPSTEDLKSFQRLQEEQLAELTDDSGEGPSLRHKAGVRLALKSPFWGGLVRLCGDM